jgi:hypothetical protein
MKKLFEIDENEKKRILEMHEKATKRNYLSEQETPQTTQPPQQSTVATSEGKPLTNYKNYTIENIKDETSLNQFVNWGTKKGEPDFGKSPNVTQRSDAYMARMVGFPNMEDEDLRQVTGHPDYEKVHAALDKSYLEMDKIAQNYTISELCGKPEVKSGIDPKTLEIARIRVSNMGLNWCGQPELGAKSKAEREAAKAAQTAAQQKARLEREKGKF